MKKISLTRYAYLSLAWLLLLPISTFGTGQDRVGKYVERVNAHLIEHPELINPTDDGIAPFVMDWSEDLFKTPYLSEDTQQALNEKLTFLAQHTGYRFFVLVSPTLPFYADNLDNLIEEVQDAEQQFNQAVYEQSYLSNIDGKKIVFLSLWRTEFILDPQVDWEASVLSSAAVGLSTSPDVDSNIKSKFSQYSEQWISQYQYNKKRQHFILRSKDFNGDAYVNSLTKHIYKELPKPLWQRSYYITYKGEIVEFDLRKSASDIAGQKEMYKLKIIRDERLKDYAYLLKRQKTLKEILDRNKFNKDRSGNDHYAREFNANNEHLDRFEERTQTFEPINHGLKETSIVSGEVPLQYVRWYVYDEFKGLLDTGEDRWQSPGNKHFILGKNQKEYEEALRAIDIMSGILSPFGLDFVADGFGAVYAGYYGDYANAAIYGGAILIPVAHPAVFREIVKGARVIQKRASNFELVLKADVLFTGIPVRFRQIVPPHILSKLELDEAKALLDRIKNLNLSDEALGQLGKDLEVDAFFDALRKEPGLVDSWNIIKSAPDLSRNVTDLQVVADFVKRSNGRADELKDAFDLSGDKRKFIDDLASKGPGDIIGNKVDGIFLSNPEKKFLSNYKNANHVDLTELEAIRKFRTLKQAVPETAELLRRADVNNDIINLEKLLIKAQNDVSRLDKLWEVTGGNYDKFKRFVGYLDDFKRNPIDPNIKPSYFNNPANEFKDINMQHILDKHTLEHFDFSNPQNLGTSVDMFKPGTTQRQVADYIDEALTELKNKRGAQFPLDEEAEEVLLKNKLSVVIGSQTLNGQRVIGQFYPIGGVDMISFTQKELKALRQILN